MQNYLKVTHNSSQLTISLGGRHSLVYRTIQIFSIEHFTRNQLQPQTSNSVQSNKHDKRLTQPEITEDMIESEHIPYDAKEQILHEVVQQRCSYTQEVS